MNNKISTKYKVISFLLAIPIGLASFMMRGKDIVEFFFSGPEPSGSMNNAFNGLIFWFVLIPIFIFVWFVVFLTVFTMIGKISHKNN